MSPRKYLENKQIWNHTPDAADRYQGGILHPHNQPLETTATTEFPQETWKEEDPGSKGTSDCGV